MRLLDIRRTTTGSDGSLSGQPGGLPEDLLQKAAGRLRVVALIFAFGVLLGNFIPPLFDPTTRDVYQSVHGWGPGVASIILGLSVAWLASRPNIPSQTLMDVGLVFGVLGSFGIAFASYWRIYAGLAYQPEHLDLLEPGYVAPWIIAFMVLIPNRPSRSLVAGVISAASVPLVWLFTMRYGGTTITLPPGHFFTALVLPYIVIVMLAYVGAKLIYSLGTDVKEARQLGSYHLTERLGAGGMGEVWRAEHRTLARPAAIKLVRPDILANTNERDHKEILQRFEREAQMTALMRSPHTIGLYDFGVAANGVVYYVMELLEGLDLVDLIDQYGPIPSERAIHLLRQICDSLGEAHQKGLIHRDIKAANIYLCRYGRSVDFVKVLDFGLVTLRQDRQAESPSTTGAFQVGGTPAYMAPEQAEGGRLDSRSDLYSLGCVGYWLLTGFRVFECSSALETMAHHVKTTPVPPSQRSELPISPSLEQVILRCLAKDPDRRPQSADELDRLLEDAESEPRWTQERAARWWDEHRPESGPTLRPREGGLVTGISLVRPSTAGSATVPMRDYH
jgi:serine/threonine protein kinase